MAEIRSIEMYDNEIEIKLSISKSEYKNLKQDTSDIIILPCGKESLTRSLTTGKLGNSNRIMLPKKLLQSLNINELDKKVPANAFTIDGDTFLLIKINKSGLGIPKFGEERDESHDRS